MEEAKEILDMLMFQGPSRHTDWVSNKQWDVWVLTRVQKRKQVANTELGNNDPQTVTEVMGVTDIAQF